MCVYTFENSKFLIKRAVVTRSAEANHFHSGSVTVSHSFVEHPLLFQPVEWQRNCGRTYDQSRDETKKKTCSQLWNINLYCSTVTWFARFSTQNGELTLFPYPEDSIKLFLVLKMCRPRTWVLSIFSAFFTTASHRLSHQGMKKIFLQD